MKRWIGAFALVLMLVTLGYGQGSGPITVKEVDGSPACNNCRTIIFPNSSLTVSGNQATVASGGGSGTVTSISVVTANGVSASCATCTTTPALTFVLGAITPTTVNGLTVTTTSSGVLTIANNKTLTVSNTLTFTGTDGSSVAFGAGGTVLYNGGALGTPSSGTLTNATGLPISTGLTGAGTGVLTALGVNVGSSGAFVVNGGALGTPASGVLTNATGLPPTTGISGWPANASGVLTNNGSGTLSWAAAGGGITIGTTTITSGTATRLLYETSGNVIGEISGATSNGTNVTFGSGNLLATSPVFTTDITTPLVKSAAGSAIAVTATAPAATTGASQVGVAATLTASAAVASTDTAGAAAGGAVTITAGAAARNASGNANGGSIFLIPGAGIGTGTTGAVGFGGTTSSFPGLFPSTYSGAPALFVTGADSGSTTMRILAAGRAVFNTTVSGISTPIISVNSNNNYISLASGLQFQWVSSSTNAENTGDTGLARAAAGVVKPTNASTGAGTFSAVAVTPAQITSDQNNYTPGVGWFQRWSSDASRNVTGLTAGQDGQVVEIWNVGSQNIVLQNQNASSTAANRFLTSTGADLTLAADKCAEGRYDATTARWRVRLCN